MEHYDLIEIKYYEYCRFALKSIKSGNNIIPKRPRKRCYNFNSKCHKERNTTINESKRSQAVLKKQKRSDEWALAKEQVCGILERFGVNYKLIKTVPAPPMDPPKPKTDPGYGRSVDRMELAVGTALNFKCWL
ncbi:hypothetical protein Tco_0132492 [Tanacetum coccineum]